MNQVELELPEVLPGLVENFTARFERPPTIITRAPGRIEFIGNHTDYNGGTVLGAAIDRAVWVAFAPRDDGLRRFASDRTPRIIERADGNFIRAEGNDSWINYPLGVLAALPEFELKGPQGFDYLVGADLPPGAGLSSSAALELSSALAFLEAVGAAPAREVLVKVGRHAENHFVGVPCGILDQGVSGFGQKGNLVLIDCRGPTFAPVPLPASAHFWIFNTHTKHALVDGLYSERHAECFAAAKALGVNQLADLTPGQLADALAAVQPPLAENVEKRAKHIVDEIARVDAAVAALQAEDLATVGTLLTASHRSSQLLFENSTAELDFLVDYLIAIPGVHGARLTGGGFGGAVMALTGPEFGMAEASGAIMAYTAKFGQEPEVLHALTANGAQRVR
jgi:galactokinase